MATERGLTLLELMVVVFILSTLALSAVSLVGRTDHQLRYDDTRGRLGQLRRAIVGEPGGDTISGYVADMGVLPGAVADLVTAPANAEDFGIKSPAVGSVTLPGLPKGWRGPYLTLPPAGASASVRFRDGWGNVSRDASGDPDTTADATEHGWDFSLAGGALTVTSHGADGLPGDAGETAYDGDVIVTIGAGEWRVDVEGWSVDVRNATGQSRDLVVAILVYEYDATNGSTWRQYDSETVAVADGTTASLVFQAGGDRVVPVGRHLLVVIEDDADDEPYRNGDATYTTRQVAFGARALPAVELAIR